MDIAVDIIFSLPEEIVKKSIEISNKKQQFSEKKLCLSIEKNIPHVSLWMGILPFSKLEMLHEKLLIFTEKNNFPKLIINKISSTIDTINPIFSFDIEQNKALLFWHNEISKMGSDLATTTTAKQSHFAEEKIDINTLNYLSNFHTLHTGKYFRPHITLGFGKIEKSTLHISFQPTAIATYQLGNYCSCHRLIKQISSNQESEY